MRNDLVVYLGIFFLSLACMLWNLMMIQDSEPSPWDPSVYSSWAQWANLMEKDKVYVSVCMHVTVNVCVSL